MANEADILLEGMDENDISSILKTWKNVDAVKKDIEKKDQMLRDKIKGFLKEHDWGNYKDPKSNISVSIIVVKREDVDKGQLKLILDPSQYAKVVKVSSFEQMKIMTPESRERLKKFVKGPKL